MTKNTLELCVRSTKKELLIKTQLCKLRVILRPRVLQGGHNHVVTPKNLPVTPVRHMKFCRHVTVSPIPHKKTSTHLAPIAFDAEHPLANTQCVGKQPKPAQLARAVFFARR